MFRWGFLFWLDWLLLVVWLCIKKIFSCIGNLIITGMIFVCTVIYAISSLTGMDIADLFMLIWDFVGSIIDLIKRVLTN